MADDENVNQEPQDIVSETPSDRPVFNPEMIIENSYTPDIGFPDFNSADYIEKKEE